MRRNGQIPPELDGKTAFLFYDRCSITSNVLVFHDNWFDARSVAARKLGTSAEFEKVKAARPAPKAAYTELARVVVLRRSGFRGELLDETDYGVCKYRVVDV